MIKLVVDTILRFHNRPQTTRYQLLSLSAGAFMALITVPWLLILLGRYAEPKLPFHWPLLLDALISVTTLPVGIYFLGWTIRTQWRIGRGTPAPFAPTQKLVITGPYKLCRNPLQLGALFYYLGVGTFFVTPTTGIIGALCVLVCGSIYHKLVEEKELAARFGSEYLAYKMNTPFLIPRFGKNHK